MKKIKNYSKLYEINVQIGANIALALLQSAHNNSYKVELHKAKRSIFQPTISPTPTGFCAPKNPAVEKDKKIIKNLKKQLKQLQLKQSDIVNPITHELFQDNELAFLIQIKKADVLKALSEADHFQSELIQNAFKNILKQFEKLTKSNPSIKNSYSIYNR